MHVCIDKQFSCFSIKFSFFLLARTSLVEHLRQYIFYDDNTMCKVTRQYYVKTSTDSLVDCQNNLYFSSFVFAVWAHDKRQNEF